MQEHNKRLKYTPRLAIRLADRAALAGAAHVGVQGEPRRRAVRGGALRDGAGARARARRRGAHRAGHEVRGRHRAHQEEAQGRHQHAPARVPGQVQAQEVLPQGQGQVPDPVEEQEEEEDQGERTWMKQAPHTPHPTH